MSSTQNVDTDWLKSVIEGSITFRRCPSCEGRGFTSEESEFDDGTAFSCTFECNICNCLGYIENPS